MNNNIDRLKLWNGNKKFYFNILYDELKQKYYDLEFILLLLNELSDNDYLKQYNPEKFLYESLINIFKKISELSHELKDYYSEFFSDFKTKFIDKNKENIRLLRNTDEHFIERIYGVNSHGKKIKKKPINKFGISVDELSTIIIQNSKYKDNTGEYLIGMSHNDLVGFNVSKENIQSIKKELLSNLKNRIK